MKISLWVFVGPLCLSGVLYVLARTVGGVGLLVFLLLSLIAAIPLFGVPVYTVLLASKVNILNREHTSTHFMVYLVTFNILRGGGNDDDDDL